LTSPTGRKAKIPKIEVYFNDVVTSAHGQANTTVIQENTLSDMQVVVAAGENSKFKIGDWICINVDKFPKVTRPGKFDMGEVQSIIPPLHKVGDTDYLFISDREVRYKVIQDIETVAEA